MEELKARGNALFARGKHREAAALYVKALEVVDEEDKRGKAVLYSNCSGCLFAEGDFEMALQSGAQAVEEDPTFEKSYLRCAAVHDKRGEKGQAELQRLLARELAARLAQVGAPPPARPLRMTEHGIEGWSRARWTRPGCRCLSAPQSTLSNRYFRLRGFLVCAPKSAVQMLNGGTF
jgi:tetratricopeptide (TPR) repeat protein